MNKFDTLHDDHIQLNYRYTDDNCNSGEFTFYCTESSFKQSQPTDTTLWTSNEMITYNDESGIERQAMAEIKFYGCMHDPIFTITIPNENAENECVCESLL